MGGSTIGLVGWGGAQVIIPGMTYKYQNLGLFNGIGLSQLSATGISLSCLSLSTISSSIQFIKDNKLNIEIACCIGIPSTISARLSTIYIAKRLSNDALALFFNGASIILIPTHFIIQQRRKNKEQQQQQQQDKSAEHAATQLTKTTTRADDDQKKTDESSSSQGTTTTISLLPTNSCHLDTKEVMQHSTYGIISGLISSLMGVGGLPLTMSYLTEYGGNLHHHDIQGTAITALIPSIITSAYSRRSAIYKIPNYIPIVSCVSLGAIIGSYVGSYFAIHKLNENELRNLYMASLVVFGSRSIYGATSNIKNIIKQHSK